MSPRGQSPLVGLEDCIERIVGTRYNYYDSPFGRHLSECEPLPENAIGYNPLPKEYWFNLDIVDIPDGTDMVDWAVNAWESILSGRAISVYEILEHVRRFKTNANS